jgi:iron(III) transport system substrate-binding protein
MITKRPSTRLLAAPVALLSLLVVVVAGAGCSSTDDSETITVYSGRSAELIQPLLDRFTEETGIEVEAKFGDSAELALLIDTEGQQSPADVFISQNPGATSYLGSKDRLTTLPTDLLQLVPPGDQGSSGQWVGLSGRVRVLVYNEDMVDPAQLPTSVIDLTQEQYRGQVGVAPQNGSFQDFVSAMRVQLGDDATQSWLDGMAANDSPVYANNVAIVEAVGRGEVPMGLVNHYYNERAKKEDPNIKSENYFFPNGDVGSLLIVTAGSVVDTTDNTEAAERLLRFMLSEQSQQYFADETLEYPLVVGVPGPEGPPPLPELDTDRVDFDQLGAEFQATLRMIEDSGIDS